MQGLDLRQALAQAEAQIEILQTQLATAQRAQSDAEAKAGTAQQQADTATATISDLQTQLTTATAERDTANRRFAALYGDPMEEGIVRGPAPYVTTCDKKCHDTLDAARVHLLAQAAGLSPDQARLLRERSAIVVPLIQKGTVET